MAMNEREEFLIQEYADGELDDAQRVEAEALLTASAEARAFLAELQSLDLQFAAIADVPLTRDLSAQIVQQVTQESMLDAATSLWGRWLLLTQIIIAAILLWQLWPRLDGWLENGRLAFEMLIADIELPTFAFAELWTGWETAVFKQTDQFIPVINLPPQQWALLIFIVFVIWLAGNRLLFTNNNGGSHG